MGNIHFQFQGFRKKPHISIDGKDVKINRDWKTNGLSVQVSFGDHAIVVCEKRIFYKWYWWIMCLHVLYPLLCFRGFSGKQLGYDGECMAIAFKITCADRGVCNIELFRRENSWDTTSSNASYTSLSLRSNTHIHIDSTSLDCKRISRLKLGMIVPFFLVSVIFTIAWIHLLIQNNMSYFDIILYCMIEVIVLAYSTYKIYKIKTQKSFSECSKISRVDISIKTK